MRGLIHVLKNTWELDEINLVTKQVIADSEQKEAEGGT
jgi:hypothetical protein